MKLECNSCGTKFRIADELVRGKSVKFKCKQCAAVLEATLPAPSRGAQDAVAPAPTEAPLLTSPGQGPPPLPKRLWYLAVGERQEGPLRLEEIAVRLSRGLVSPEDLVWREGLQVWRPIAFVDEVEQALRRQFPHLVQGIWTHYASAPAGPGWTGPASLSPGPQPGSAPEAVPGLVDLAAMVSSDRQPSAGARAEVNLPAVAQLSSQPVMVTDGSAIAALHSGALALAPVAEPAPAPAPAPAPPPTPAPAPAPAQEASHIHTTFGSLDEASAEAQLPVPGRSWLLWGLAAAGIAVLGLGLGLFLGLGRQAPAASAAGEAEAVAMAQAGRPAPRLQGTGSPLAHLPLSREQPAQTETDLVLPNPPPIEVKRPRRRRQRAAAGLELPSDRGPTLQGPPQDRLLETIAQRPKDAKTVLASRVFSRNRASLMACDRLAERRGENLDKVRAAFKIQVSAEGEANVWVQGPGVSTRLMSCYRSVAKHWRFPITGMDYSTSFWHMH